MAARIDPQSQDVRDEKVRKAQQSLERGHYDDDGALLWVATNSDCFHKDVGIVEEESE